MKFNREIENDFTLRLFGLSTFLGHVFTAVYWLTSFSYRRLSDPNLDPICFPYLPSCDFFYNKLGVGEWALILVIYFFVSIVGGILFLTKKWQIAYYLAMPLFLFKLFYLSLNYINMGNYHYMHFIFTFVFLFFPNKHKALYLTVILFYFSAGLIKFNMEWLSGAAMIKTPFVRGPLLKLGLFYVVLLEIALVWLLLKNNMKLRAAIILQLLGFHIFSWHIVGFLYPLIMMSFLGPMIYDIFKNYHFDNPFINLKLKYDKFLMGMALFFISMQLLPFALAKDPSLDGYSRLTSLNMFDSYSKCKAIALMEKPNAITQFNLIEHVGVRIKCDPVFFHSKLKILCKKNSTPTEKAKISFTLYSKRTTDSEFSLITKSENYCEYF